METIIYSTETRDKIAKVILEFILKNSSLMILSNLSKTKELVYLDESNINRLVMLHNEDISYLFASVYDHRARVLNHFLQFIIGKKGHTLCEKGSIHVHLDDSVSFDDSRIFIKSSFNKETMKLFVKNI